MRAASRHYIDKNCSLDLLADAIEERFQTQKYETQSSKEPDGWLVQAKKESILRDLAASERAFTVTLTGLPNNFTVSFGIGKWIQNLGFAVLEGLLVAPIFLYVEVPASLWSYEIENEFWKFVEQQVVLRV